MFVFAQLGHKIRANVKNGRSGAKGVATATDTPSRPISLATVKGPIRRTIIDPRPTGPERSWRSRVVFLESRLHRHLQPAGHGGAANTRTLAAEVPKSWCPLAAHFSPSPPLGVPENVLALVRALSYSPRCPSQQLQQRYKW